MVWAITAFELIWPPNIRPIINSFHFVYSVDLWGGMECCKRTKYEMVRKVRHVRVSENVYSGCTELTAERLLEIRNLQREARDVV